MKKPLYAVLLIMLIGAAFFASQMVLPDKPEPVAAPNTPAVDPKPSVENSQVEEKVYNKGGKILVYNHASPEVLEALGELQNGSKVNVLGKENDFYHVKYDAQGETKEGYIPTWYLDDNKAVAECDYGYQVLKEGRKGLLYPDGPEIVGLKQGKLLRPFLESGDWVQVDIMVYDIPAVLNAWVKKADLTSPDKMQAKEGFIPSDAELYFVDSFEDIKAAKPQKEAYPKNIYIEKREGGYAYIGAAGGWTAWVEEKWIRYTDKDLK